jgi:hypothetical protein
MDSCDFLYLPLGISNRFVFYSLSRPTIVKPAHISMVFLSICQLRPYPIYQII